VARQIYNDSTHFSIVSEGAAGHWWAQVIGEWVDELFEGPGHTALRATVRDLFTLAHTDALVERVIGPDLRDLSDRLARGQTVDIAARARILVGRSVSDLVGLRPEDIAAAIGGDPTDDMDALFLRLFHHVEELVNLGFGTMASTTLDPGALARARELAGRLRGRPRRLRARRPRHHPRPLPRTGSGRAARGRAGRPDGRGGHRHPRQRHDQDGRDHARHRRAPCPARRPRPAAGRGPRDPARHQPRLSRRPLGHRGRPLRGPGSAQGRAREDLHLDDRQRRRGVQHRPRLRPRDPPALVRRWPPPLPRRATRPLRTHRAARSAHRRRSSVGDRRTALPPEGFHSHLRKAANPSGALNTKTARYERGHRRGCRFALTAGPRRCDTPDVTRSRRPRDREAEMTRAGTDPGKPEQRGPKPVKSGKGSAGKAGQSKPQLRKNERNAADRKMFGRWSFTAWLLIVTLAGAVLGAMVTLQVLDWIAIARESGGSCGSSRNISYGACPRYWATIFVVSLFGLMVAIPL